MSPEVVRYQPFGECAVLVEFAAQIDPTIHTAVLSLQTQVRQWAHPGILSCVPAYASLLIRFDPQLLSHTQLIAQLRTFAELPGNLDTPSRQVVIPVCYAPPFAPDMEQVSATTGLSRAQIIDLHTNTQYRVYMIGFLPGFPYLGRLPAALTISRRANPRTRVPAGSVGLAGQQTGIYPSEAPGGWQLIGRTPWRLFDPTVSPPTLLQVGDRVRFRQIETAEYEALAQQPANDTAWPSS